MRITGITGTMNETVAGKGKGIFFGWWVVGATAVCMSTGTGPFAFAALGLFVLPFTEEFGWNRAEISFCLTLLIGTTAVILPFIGRLVDRFGSRVVMIPSMVSLALCLAAIPLFVSELWHLIVVFLLIGTIGAGTNSVPYMPIVSAWFLRKRGLAIGIAISGIGLGYTYVPLLVQFFIDNYGWRSGWYALSAVILFIAIPVAAIFLKESPASMGLQPDGITTNVAAPRATRKDVGLTTREVLRHREFWILCGIFIVLSFVLNGMLSALVPMLIDRGMDTTTAAAVAATTGLTVFVSRIVIGFLIDHFFAPYVAMFFFTLSAIGIGIFALGAINVTAFLAAILVGLSLGAEVDLLAYLTGRYFGLRSFGATYGLLFAAILTGTALGPLAFGIGFESTGSYTLILIISVGINILAIALTAMLGQYPDWEKVEE